MKQSSLISNRKYKAMKALNIWVSLAVVAIWAVLVSASNIYDDHHAFTEVEIEGPAEVLLVHGPEAAVSQRNGGSDVSITIENKTLKIRAEKGSNPSIIRVTYNKLFNLVAKEGAIVTAREAIPAERLEIALENKAHANLNFKAEMVNAYAEGQSSLTAVGEIENFTVDFEDSELQHRQLRVEHSSVSVREKTAMKTYKPRNNSLLLR
ncbi:MAG: DUF2807 domain-containing protein [Saprospiraceae bacterium]|nr:DUF2807 domain-containing protein [Saprospiraceae bacterium]